MTNWKNVLLHWKTNLMNMSNMYMSLRKIMLPSNIQFLKSNCSKKIWKIGNALKICGYVGFLNLSVLKRYARTF